MGLFFFVVGMEIKRELVHGELRDPRAVTLPLMAAFGGMLVPALIYLAINGTSAGRDGWGIPMATDVAFALGVVAVLGARVPASVKVLLLTLAIVDDIGAIVVIAVFYSSDVDSKFLVYAAGVAVLVAAVHKLDVSYPLIPLGLGLVLWLMVYESGVHATIAGVVMGLLTPATPRQNDLEADDVVDMLANRPDVHASDVRLAAWAIRGSISACDRLIDVLHPWTSFFVVPLFALANAGVEIRGECADEPDDGVRGVLVGTRRGQARSESRRSRGWRYDSASAGSRQAPTGGTSSASGRSPASVSRCPCSSPAWHSTTSPCRTTPSSGRSPPRSSLPSPGGRCSRGSAEPIAPIAPSEHWRL